MVVQGLCSVQTVDTSSAKASTALRCDSIAFHKFVSFLQHHYTLFLENFIGHFSDGPLGLQTKNTVI